MKVNALFIALFSVLPLSFAIGRAQSDPGAQLIGSMLASLSALSGGKPTDCGSTPLNRPDAKVTACAQASFEKHKPFHILYESTLGLFKYGLAGDANGNIYEVEYDARALLNFGARKRSQTSDGNRIRVTSCIRPIRLGNTQQGPLACITPINELQSRLGAQQKPIDTTICAILENPSAFNNKLVRFRGYAFGNFEYSELGTDDCSGLLWFEYGNGGGPPDLAATVRGGARPGSEDVEGRLILPVPVELIEDLSFQRFQKLMRARAKADKRNLKEGVETPTFYRVAATFTGRIDAVSDDVHAFHLKRKDTDRADFLGFGQMGLFDAQLVLQSVGDDPILEKFHRNAGPELGNPNRSQTRSPEKSAEKPHVGLRDAPGPTMIVKQLTSSLRFHRGHLGVVSAR